MAGATIKPQSTAGVSAPTSGSDETRLWSQAGMCIVEAVLGFLILYGCLIVVDLPLLDVYPDRKLNTLRYIGTDNVYRDEDYSRYHVNSFGLIGPEPAPVSDNGVYRIAVFGDSFVEALQVPQERKFAALLEDALAAPNGKRRVEVWNVGHSADNTGNAYARWLQLKNMVQFDLVVFAFNEGDVLENRLEDVRDRSGSFLEEDTSGGFQLVQPDAVGEGQRFAALNAMLPRFHNFHYQLRNRTEDYLRDSRRRLISRLRAWRGDAQEPRDVAQHALSIEQLENSARQLHFVYDSIAATGVPVTMLGLPTDAAAPAGFASHEPGASFRYVALTERLRRAGVPLVDPYAAIAAEIAQGCDPYSDWEPFHHFNARGHRIIAGALVDYLSRHRALGFRACPGYPNAVDH